jgi:hypothetical protein
MYYKLSITYLMALFVLEFNGSQRLESCTVRASNTAPERPCECNAQSFSLQPLLESMSSGTPVISPDVSG